MIVINNLKKVVKDNLIFLCSDVDIPKKAYEKWYHYSLDARNRNDFSYISYNYIDEMPEKATIWFSVDIKFNHLLCDSRVDAILVALLYFALITGEDIYTNLVVSKKLLFQLNDILIPMLCKYSNRKIIKIIAETSSAVFNNNNLVGTGMSCGVDSFFTLKKYSDNSIDKEYKINTLTYLNVGADRFRLKRSMNANELKNSLLELEQMRRKRIEIAKQISIEYNCNFIEIDSNISDLYQGMFEESHIYRSCSAIMALQNGFKKYYFSSTGLNVEDFTPSLQTDPGHYEVLLLNCLSTDNLDFISAGKAYNRVDKMAEISSMDVAMNYLRICDKEKPCYHCTKDYRTIIIIDLLKKHNEYSKIYDIEKSKKVRGNAYCWLLRTKKTNEVAQMLYPLVKKEKLIPLKAYFLFFVQKPYIFIRRIINR